MALADIPTGGQRRRLDSWKEIAEYLGRDVRTATRWEAQGLPLHRVPGGRGSSVFAFTDEIDAWMASPRAARAGADVPEAVPHPAPAPATTPVPPRSRRRAALVSGLVVAVAVAGVWLSSRRDGLDADTLRASVTPTEVSLSDASGRTRVIHRFAPGALMLTKAPVRLRDIDRDGTADALVAVVAYDDPAARTTAGGEILNVAIAGGVHWRFAFDDVATFGVGKNAGPWAVSDWQVDSFGAGDRIAVAAHDFTWWASIVTVLGADGRRRGSFVNPGWIESVLWLEDGRLAVGGFNNLRDEAVLAILDGSQLAGQAPGSAGTAFACLSCPDDAPLFYATFARSEVNRVTASRFNRAQVGSRDGTILVTTSETGSERSEVNAMYEFDRDMRLLSARYSDRYWDEHRRLELEGRLTHTRDTCPERDGPPAIHVWSQAGWQRVASPR